MAGKNLSAEITQNIIVTRARDGDTRFWSVCPVCADIQESSAPAVAEVVCDSTCDACLEDQALRDAESHELTWPQEWSDAHDRDIALSLNALGGTTGK